MTIKLNGTDTLEAFRRAILNALDATTAELFNEKDGWKDQDLPALFRAIDTHTMTLAKRHGIELTDD